MTVETGRGSVSRGRLADRAQAGELLRPLLRRACTTVPVVVGLGAGGATVAAAAKAPESPLAVLGLQEFGLPEPMQPGRACGAVSSDGRLLVRGSAVGRLEVETEHLRRCIRHVRAAQAAHATVGAGLPDMAGREVVLVDDGTSSPSVLSAAVDFIRRRRPLRVTVAVACAPRERIREIEAFAGDIVVAAVPAWADWFHWHGRLYESDRLVDPPEARRLLPA